MAAEGDGGRRRRKATAGGDSLAQEKIAGEIDRTQEARPGRRLCPPGSPVGERLRSRPQVVCSFRSSASRPRLIWRQRSGALDSRSFCRAEAVIGRCWQARFTHDIGSVERRCCSRNAAQVGVGVEVAGERLDGGAPLVALVALLEGDRLGDEDVDAEEHARRARGRGRRARRGARAGERDWICADGGDGADGVEVARAGVALAAGEGQQLAARARGEQGGGQRGGPVEDQGERGAREEADVLEGQDRQEAGAG